MDKWIIDRLEREGVKPENGRLITLEEFMSEIGKGKEFKLVYFDNDIFKKEGEDYITRQSDGCYYPLSKYCLDPKYRLEKLWCW